MDAASLANIHGTKNCYAELICKKRNPGKTSYTQRNTTLCTRMKREEMTHFLRMPLSFIINVSFHYLINNTTTQREKSTISYKTYEYCHMCRDRLIIQ